MKKDVQSNEIVTVRDRFLKPYRSANDELLGSLVDCSMDFQSFAQKLNSPDSKSGVPWEVVSRLIQSAEFGVQIRQSVAKPLLQGKRQFGKVFQHRGCQGGIAAFEGRTSSFENLF